MRIRTLTALGLAAALGACGGDDLAAPAPSADQPPSFGVNELDLTFAENGTAPVTKLLVNDEDANDISFSLSGADADRFTISATGELEFATPPDFESPQDSNGDNVYEVIVTATDRGTNAGTIEVSVTVTDNSTAMRFVDQVFAAAEPLGIVTLAAPSGNLPVTLLGPAGDSWLETPLVVIGGNNPAQLSVTAEDFARRGYLVASVPGANEADLQAVALALRGNAVAGLGVDTGAIAVAGTGDAADPARLAAALAGSDIPSFGLAANVPVEDAAAHFHSQLFQGVN